MRISTSNLSSIWMLNFFYFFQKWHYFVTQHSYWRRNLDDASPIKYCQTGLFEIFNSEIALGFRLKNFGETAWGKSNKYSEGLIYPQCTTSLLHSDMIITFLLSKSLDVCSSKSKSVTGFDVELITNLSSVHIVLPVHSAKTVYIYSIWATCVRE